MAISSQDQHPANSVVELFPLISGGAPTMHAPLHEALGKFLASRNNAKAMPIFGADGGIFPQSAPEECVCHKLLKQLLERCWWRPITSFPKSWITFNKHRDQHDEAGVPSFWRREPNLGRPATHVDFDVRFVGEYPQFG
jgi:hypothetical protein